MSISAKNGMLEYLLRAVIEGCLSPAPAGIPASLLLLHSNLSRFQSSSLQTYLGFVPRPSEKWNWLRSAETTQELKMDNWKSTNKAEVSHRLAGFYSIVCMCIWEEQSYGFCGFLLPTNIRILRGSQVVLSNNVSLRIGLTDPDPIVEFSVQLLEVIP